METNSYHDIDRRMEEAFGFMNSWPTTDNYEVRFTTPERGEHTYFSVVFINGVMVAVEGGESPHAEKYENPLVAIDDTLRALEDLQREYHIIVRSLPQMRFLPQLNQYRIRMRLVLIPLNEAKGLGLLKEEKADNPIPASACIVCAGCHHMEVCRYNAMVQQLAIVGLTVAGECHGRR
jgi:hypothetical protein